MARIACTMMQKNETVLLRPWLEYHGRLFGFENLFVFDNGSTELETLVTLREYERKGVHLDRSKNTVADYALKGDIIANLIRNFQHDKTYEVVFPLDCDEFVVLKDGSEATASKEKILAYTDSISGLGGLFRVDRQLFNVINRRGEFAIQNYTKTVIVLDGNFLSSDHGHHYCTLSSADGYRPCEFAYVHYHYKPLTMLKQHARAKLAPFVNVDDPAGISAFSGPGHHLIPYLTMTEDEFQNWHKGDKFFVFEEFTELLSQLNATIPF